MTFRKFATGAALAIAGLMAAVGIGLLANSISGDNVGLGAEPLSAGETLAPASATKADDAARSARSARKRNRNRGGDDKPADTVTVPPSSGTGGTATTFDDHGGIGRQRATTAAPRAPAPARAGPAPPGSGSTPGGSGSGDSSGSGSSGGSGGSSHSGGSDDDYSSGWTPDGAPGEGVQTGAGTEIRH